MKLLRFEVNDEMRYGVREDDDIVDLTTFLNPSTPTFADLLTLYVNGDTETVDAVVSEARAAGTVFEADEVRIAPPLADGGRLICLGGMFTSHLTREGVGFTRAPNQWTVPRRSVVGPDEPIMLDERVVECTKPAVELAVVISEGGKYVSETEVFDHVVGYTVANDVTARTEWPGTMGYKLMDTFSPLGPHIVTDDEIANPYDLDMSISQAGETMCRGNTAGLRFTVAFALSFLSSFIKLRPGDVISTGDPAGIEGSLTPGETVELRIEDIGTLANPVTRAADTE
jgi:2-keto-4-pentenoate hydratase/2-oxohepta-3-ene-1,7-dioic acid hydratase in catechol pathway